jgi:hypothetical protein
MRNIALFRGFLSAALFLPAVGFAQFTISGVADKATYNDSVTLTVVTQAGYRCSATLNWKPLATGAPAIVNRPDFYELRVDATNETTSAVTSQYLRFIVAASERVGTEWGLPRHVPFPLIQSCSNEFTGARLRLLVPSAFPSGYSIPMVSWVLDDQEHPVRANGILMLAGTDPLFQIKRGVGSGFIQAKPSGTVNFVVGIADMRTNVTIAIETNITWTPVAGTLSGATTWSNNSRIQITGGVIIPAGSSLTVGEGTIVRVNAGLDITNNGAITINGTVADPVVFMGTTAAPWGGFVQHANNASFTATGAIFTGSGEEPCWYSNSERGCATGLSGLGSHRTEQPLVALNGTNCNLTMVDSAAIYLAGQVSHAEGGAAKGYDIRFTRFLMQRATSCGQFTSARLTVNDSAFIEVPDNSVNFEDEDHDAMYIVGGTHAFTNTLFGWTKDDGIDSGGTDGNSSGGFAKLTYQSCWFESVFHEGNSWSGYKNIYTRGSVYFDCGQGVESGYDAPTGRVDSCFFSMNESGIRHGDNYPNFSMYGGRVTATNNISIYNHRDLFGFNWDDSGGWTNSFDRFFATNNFVSALDTNYPNNALWNPATDAWRLGAFGGVGRVGVGFGTRSTALAGNPDGVPVGLSRFCTNEVSVDYAIDGTDGTRASGTLIFPAGLTRAFIPAPTNFTGVLRIALANPQNADVTGNSALLFQNLPPATNAMTVLSPLGANWKYLDNGSEQGVAWRGTNFDDSAWASGAARLGFGADPAPLGTTIRRYVTGTSGPQITNYYFRRSILVTNPAAFVTLQFRYQRDDGCILYLNGSEIFRNNMANGTVYATNFAMATISPASETLRFWTNTLSATNLVAGTNIIAVEVHQSTATSSDIAWEMELLGLPSPSGSAGPRVNFSRLGSDAVLYWNDPTFGLEVADVVTGPWRPADATNSPSGSPISGTRFFRLRK